MDWLNANSKLQLAIHNDLTIEIIYYDKHDYHNITGKLLKIDSMNGYLKLDNCERTIINLGNILDASVD
ncbi:hypothetical protein D8M06_07705 [Oceanobacillus halophilus]|uniref:YolD-like family protein n=1 Tax=Oceanobacillus halophilus TaxID=930130 RepID=A0A495A3X5_9BACI|nr:hypothetical protein D8M06_07705 [Oceanobacillus halophilus]